MKTNNVRLVFSPSHQKMRAYRKHDWSARKSFDELDRRCLLESSVSAQEFMRVQKIFKLMSEFRHVDHCIKVLSHLLQND